MNHSGKSIRSNLGLTKQIKIGLKSMAVKVVAIKATGFLTKLALARLLVPEIFGLFAMVTVIIGFLKVFADFGLKNALIQRRRESLSTLRYDTAFWFLAGAGVALVMLVWMVCVPLMVQFYDEPRLESIAMALALGLCLESMGVLPRVRLTRLMRFRQLMQAEVIGVLAGAVGAIILALYGAGLWALVSQSLISGMATLMLLWKATRWRPRWRFAPHTLRDVFGFSGYMLASSVLYYVRKHLDVLIVGKLLGASALGVYWLAFALTETLRMQLYSVVNKVMFPAYSRMQDDPTAMKPYYLATIRYMALVTWPFSMLLILFADPVIPALFGQVWSQAVRPVQILSAASMVFALSGTPAEVLKGLGRPDISFKISFANTVFVAFPAVYFGANQFGLTGAAWGVFVHYITSRALFHLAIRRVIFITESDVLRAIFPAMLVAGVIYIFYAMVTYL